MLKCVDCGTANKLGTKFCVACGKVLVLACHDCGHLNPIQMKFCQGCGAKTAVVPALVSEPQNPTGTPLPRDVVHPTALIPASTAQSEIRPVVDAGVGERDLISPVPEPSTSPNQHTKFNFKWLLVGSVIVSLIGMSGAGLFYVQQQSAVNPVAMTASQVATMPPATPVPVVVTTTPEPTPMATADVTASPAATIVATVEPTAIPVVMATSVKATAKPKPKLTPKPTPQQQVIHDVREAPPTEVLTPAPSGFADKFAACARLDFLNKAACELKLCFNNPSAQECKREPSVQDRQRR